MKSTETKQILDYFQAIDNRKVTPQITNIWHELIGHLDFDIARQASMLCREDSGIEWVEPRHLLAKARLVKESRLTDDRREQALNPSNEKVGVPMPKCVHNIGLLLCEPCCHQMAIDAGLIADKPYRKKLR
jgi:hypothetical protein